MPVAIAAVHSGLSPRVRGIRPLPAEKVVHVGSIPACTGNPRLTIVHLSVARVYPRVYGESGSG